MPLKLKFPVLKKIDYIDISKNGVNVLMLDSKSDGLKWRDFQKLIGEKCGAGIFSYSLKQTGSNDVHIGRVKSVITSLKPVVKNDDKDFLSLNNKFNELSTKIDSMQSGGGITYDALLEVTKSSYLSRIEFLGVDLKRKDEDYRLLLVKYEKLEVVIEEFEAEIKELEGQTGIMQYIDIAKDFLKMKAGNAKPIESLANSDVVDIPPGITEVLGAVDWMQVSDEIKAEIMNYLQIFITKLPLKGV